MKTIFKSKLVVIIFLLTFLFACKSNAGTNADEQIIESDTITTMSDTTGNAIDTTNSRANTNERVNENGTMTDTTTTPDN